MYASVQYYVCKIVRNKLKNKCVDLNLQRHLSWPVSYFNAGYSQIKLQDQRFEAAWPKYSTRRCLFRSPIQEAIAVIRALISLQNYCKNLFFLSVAYGFHFPSNCVASKKFIFWSRAPLSPPNVNLAQVESLLFAFWPWENGLNPGAEVEVPFRELWPNSIWPGWCVIFGENARSVCAAAKLPVEFFPDWKWVRERVLRGLDDPLSCPLAWRSPHPLEPEAIHRG